MPDATITAPVGAGPVNRLSLGVTDAAQGSAMCAQVQGGPAVPGYLCMAVE